MKSRAIYIWIGANNRLRWKIKTVPIDKRDMLKLKAYPWWNYDGSSTGQAEGENTEVRLKPVRVYPFPYKDDADVMILCETYNVDNTVHRDNERYHALERFKAGEYKRPWFGNEVEYFIVKNGDNMNDLLTTTHYCGFDECRAHCKRVALEHYNACLNANLEISGMNAEVTRGQWEFQIGPCEAIKSGDHTYVALFLLIWVAEYHGCKVIVNESKPYENVNGSGCHINYSDIDTRFNDNANILVQKINKLGERHDHHMSIYGDNSKRLTGTHETSRPDVFSFGTGTRDTSVRVPTNTKKYFEDRRPASNIDYYKVTSSIYESVNNV